MTSRTTNDNQAMAAAGIAVVVEPAFSLGQPRPYVGTFRPSCSSTRRSRSPSSASPRGSCRAGSASGLLDVIGLDAGVVKGSHRRLTDRPEAAPLVISWSRPSFPREPCTRRR